MLKEAVDQRTGKPMKAKQRLLRINMQLLTRDEYRDYIRSLLEGKEAAAVAAA